MRRFGLLLILAACADAEAGTYTPPPPDAGDASIPMPDAAPPADAGADVESEAGPKLCSDHGLCPTAVPPKATLTGVWGDGTGVAWAVTESGDVLRWDGAAWKVHASGFGPLKTIWGSSPTDVWIGGEKGIHRGTGSPLAFAKSDEANATAIWNGWAATDRGLLHFDGAVWTVEPLAKGLSPVSVWGNGDAWVAAARPLEDNPDAHELVLLRKHGDGAFEEMTLPPDPDGDPTWGKPSTLKGGTSPSTGDVWIFADTLISTPVMFHGTLSGDTFTFRRMLDGRPGDPITTAVFGSDPSHVLAVGEYGRVRHWNGTTWSPVAVTITKLPVIEPFYAVFCRGNAEAWLVGKGQALRYDPTKGGLP